MIPAPGGALRLGHDGYGVTLMDAKSGKSRLELAASMLGCEVALILGYRETPEGGIVVIAPDGRKLKFTAEDLCGQRAAKPNTRHDTGAQKTRKKEK